MINQTGYVDVLPFSKGLAFNGGFCEWWFTPKNNIQYWPLINPLNQFLDSEPSLISGATWFGPIKVPNDQLGFDEAQKFSAAGIYYEQKVSGFYPGDSATSRINLENIPYHQMAVVGKMRAGGLFLLIGNEEYGLTFTHDYKSGPGVKTTAGADFSFDYQTLHKGWILPQFQGMNVTPPLNGSTGGSAGGNDDPNKTEIIVFTNVSNVTFPWNDTRKQKFGAYPLIEVWIDDIPTGGQRALANVPITVNAFPPDTSLFSVNLTGIASGIIVIK